MFDKRGINHVEVILSFVLFVVAIAFALVFFNPGNSDNLIDTSMGYVFSEIVRASEIPFEVVNIKINNDNEGIEGIEILALDISGIPAGLNSKVETSEGMVLDSSRDGDVVSVFSEEGWMGIEFVSVSFSEEFEKGSVGAGVFNEEYYSISSSEKRKVISEKNISELSGKYRTDYEGLKEEFNLPNRINFGYRLVFSEDEKIEGLREIPSNLDSFVEARRVEVLKENEEGELVLVFAKLEVILW